MLSALRGVALVLGMTGSFVAGAFSTLPAQPRAGQDFVVHFDSSLDCGNFTHVGVSSVSGSTITITYPTADICGVVQPGLYVNAAVNGLPAGTYSVVEKSSHGNTRNSGQLTILPGSTASRPSTSLAGLWYVPEAPGWGLSIAEGQSGQLFLTWYTYVGGASSATVGSPTWMYTPGGQWISGTQYTGVLAVASGTVYYRPFDPAQTVVSPIGLSTLALTGTDTLTFTAAYNIGAGDTSQSFNLTRFKF